MAPLKAAATASFNQIVKSPTTYMLVVAVSLLTYFASAYKDRSNEVSQNLISENTRLRQENLTLKQDYRDMEKKNSDLVMALLVSKEVQRALSNSIKPDSLAKTPSQ